MAASRLPVSAVPHAATYKRVTAKARFVPPLWIRGVSEKPACTACLLVPPGACLHHQVPTSRSSIALSLSITANGICHCT